MRVKDVMVTEFDTIGPDAPIRKVPGQLRTGKGKGEGGMPSILVMEGERLLGIVTLTDLVKAILPPYIAQDPHLTHLAWDGLLERQCNRLQNKPVREVMTKKVITVNEETVLTEAAELLLEHQIHTLPVLRGSRVVGILYLSDLASQVFAQLEVQS
jgi:CBS domain-containing protein